MASHLQLLAIADHIKHAEMIDKNDPDISDIKYEFKEGIVMTGYIDDKHKYAYLTYDKIKIVINIELGYINISLIEKDLKQDFNEWLQENIECIHLLSKYIDSSNLIQVGKYSTYVYSSIVYEFIRKYDEKYMITVKSMLASLAYR